MERILIIDDETEVADLIERFLKPEGFPIEKAATAKEGLALMEKILFNIVLCDIRLPDIDGKELIDLLKSFNPLCNIVMITGYTSMDNVVACLGGGAVDYFTKPFRDIDTLVHTVKELNAKISRWKKMTPIATRWPW